MLHYYKLSNYKIKKIIDCFLDDLTSMQASEKLKINRNTINKYYTTFRTIILENYKKKYLKMNKSCDLCIGYTVSEYAKLYYKVYKFNNQIWPVRIYEKPPCKKYASQDEDLKNFLFFAYKRLGKFRGIKAKHHYLFTIETVYRYYFKQEVIKSFLWQELTKKRKLNKL